MATPKIVVLCMENRSFDEYFGTFPGAVGFYDPVGAAIFPQTGFVDAAKKPIPTLRPFRTSTFSSAGEWNPSLDHGWDHQTSAWAGGALNGWAKGGANTTTMGYFAANDVPYHWLLAQNFLLCDNYFCSVLGPTWPNRLFLMSGTVFGDNPPAPGSVAQWNSATDMPTINNPQGQTFPWVSYPAMLGPQTTWKIYDDQYWQPPWMAWPAQNWPATNPPAYLAFLNSTSPAWPAPFGINMLGILQDASGVIGGVGAPGDPTHYATPAANAQYSSFEADARAGALPDVSWVVPPSFLTEHPLYLPADGESYLARVVAAVMAGDWENTILIITYDENDGHFDHVAPPTPLENEAQNEPWLSDGTNTAPVGAGFRIPTIIVSPWTVGKGVASSLTPPGTYFDHTSIVQYLESLTGAPCSNLPPPTSPGGWRRRNFQNLGMLIDTTATPTPASSISLPSVAAVDAWRLDALTRLFGGAPTIGTATPNMLLPVPDPTIPQTWPPLQQQCYFIMDKTTFGQDEVDAMRKAQNDPSNGPVTFPSAFFVVLDGFDPAELNLGPFAPAGSTPLMPQVALTIAGTTTAPGNVFVNVNPAVPDNTALPPAPQRFLFPCDVVFAGGSSDPAFGGVTLQNPLLIDVNAGFTSRLSWQAPTEQIELVEAPDPYIQNGPISWLSTDLRLFEVRANGADTFFGQMLDQSNPDPIGMIQNALAALNAPGSTLGAAFDTDPTPDPSDPSQQALSRVTVYETENGVPGAPSIFNFGVLRVTMQGLTQPAENVRVFFRMFPAQSTGTAFDPTTLYRSTPIAGGPNPANSQIDPNTDNPNNTAEDPSETWATRVPLLGIDGALVNNSDILTIPFFAVPRVDATSLPMWRQQPDWPNTQQIAPAAGGTGALVYAYFGCWVDINQSVPAFPQMVPSSGGGMDGPYTTGAPLPIKAFVKGDQCLVAEIAFDEISIPFDAAPGNSDKLAQRNMTIQGVA